MSIHRQLRRKLTNAITSQNWGDFKEIEKQLFKVLENQKTLFY
jgi:hypothetical protein